MPRLFLTLVNQSISALWLVLAVLLLRRILLRSPKWVPMLLWGLVGIRLICPISVESALSLIPSAQTIPTTILTDTTPTVHTGFPAINQTVNPVLEQSVSTSTAVSANPLQIWIPLLSVVWLMGVVVLLGWSLVSYLRLRRRVATAVRLEGNLYQSEVVLSPFVLGLLHPRIYLPFRLDQTTLDHVVAHEQAHLRRRDPWWKLLGYLLLCVYWFNPLMWAAYGAFCRDLELACDATVVKNMDSQQRADYAQALLSCNVRRTALHASPLSFGEVGVKQRVKAVLHDQRPTLLAVVVSVLVCALVGVCFLTNPLSSRNFPMTGSYVSDLEPRQIADRIAEIEGLQDGSVLSVTPGQFSLPLTRDFQIQNNSAIRFFYGQRQHTYSAQLQVENGQFTVTTPETSSWQSSIYNLRVYLDALKYLPQEEIRRLSPDADLYSVALVEDGTPTETERSISYTVRGTGSLDGWYVHLEVQPLHATNNGVYQGSSDEIIHLFYGDESISTLASYVGTNTPGVLVADRSLASMDSPSLMLSSDGSFFWSSSIVSSSATTGLYELTPDTLTLYTNQGRFAYVFRVEGDTLVYDPDASTHHLPLEDWSHLP